MKRRCKLCNKSIEIVDMYFVEISQNEQIIVCNKCMEKRDFWKFDNYPVTEDYEFMEEEEREGWKELIEYYNKD
jgi:hypothetical protein